MAGRSHRDAGWQDRGTGQRNPPGFSGKPRAQARDRAARLPGATVAIVPGSHGGFDREDEMNNRIVAFLRSVPAQAT
jgi:hypothetical protein